VLRSVGSHARAQACLEQGLALSQELDDRFGTAFQVAALGRLASSQGDHARATPLLRQALILWRDLGDLRDVGVGLDGLALAAAAQGQGRRAAQLFGAASAVRERPGLTENPIWGDDHARAVEATRGSLGEAELVAAWEEGRALPLELAIEMALGSTDPDAPAPTAEPEAAPLSQRELEVVALISQGLTNARIAAELIISERTVHRHVGNILDKLKLRSRAQVAAWAVEHGLVS
jgi:DNA-binding CsgD family transcriptional regulator